MNESEARIFNAIVDDFEISYDGSLREYREIPEEELSKYQLLLMSYLEEVWLSGEINEESRDFLLRLKKQTEEIFAQLGHLDEGDEVIISDKGVIVASDERGEYILDEVNETVRLHGKVARPVPWPLSASTFRAGDCGSTSQQTVMTFSLELDDVSVEDLETDDGDPARYFSPFEDKHVYVPILPHLGTKIRKRV